MALNIKSFRESLKVGLSKDFVEKIISRFLDADFSKVNTNNGSKLSDIDAISEENKTEVANEDISYFLNKQLKTDYLVSRGIYKATYDEDDDKKRRENIARASSELRSSLYSRPNSLTLKSASILNAPQVDECCHLLTINTDGKNIVTVVKAVYDALKKRGIPFDIEIPKTPNMGDGVTEAIKLHVTTADLEYTIKAINSIDPVYKKKINPPTMFNANVNNIIGYDSYLDINGERASSKLGVLVVKAIDKAIAKTGADLTIEGKSLVEYLKAAENQDEARKACLKEIKSKTSTNIVDEVLISAAEIIKEEKIAIDPDSVFLSEIAAGEINAEFGTLEEETEVITNENEIEFEIDKVAEEVQAEKADEEKEKRKASKERLAAAAERVKELLSNIHIQPPIMFGLKKDKVAEEEMTIGTPSVTVVEPLEKVEDSVEDKNEEERMDDLISGMSETPIVEQKETETIEMPVEKSVEASLPKTIVIPGFLKDYIEARRASVFTEGTEEITPVEMPAKKPVERDYDEDAIRRDFDPSKIVIPDFLKSKKEETTEEDLDKTQIIPVQTEEVAEDSAFRVDYVTPEERIGDRATFVNNIAHCSEDMLATVTKLMADTGMSEEFISGVLIEAGRELPTVEVEQVAPDEAIVNPEDKIGDRAAFVNNMAHCSDEMLASVTKLMADTGMSEEFINGILEEAGRTSKPEEMTEEQRMDAMLEEVSAPKEIVSGEAVSEEERLDAMLAEATSQTDSELLPGEETTTTELLPGEEIKEETTLLPGEETEVAEITTEVTEEVTPAATEETVVEETVQEESPESKIGDREIFIDTVKHCSDRMLGRVVDKMKTTGMTEEFINQVLADAGRTLPVATNDEEARLDSMLAEVTETKETLPGEEGPAQATETVETKIEETTVSEEVVEETPAQTTVSAEEARLDAMLAEATAPKEVTTEAVNEEARLDAMLAEAEAKQTETVEQPVTMSTIEIPTEQVEAEEEDILSAISKATEGEGASSLTTEEKIAVVADSIPKTIQETDPEKEAKIAKYPGVMYDPQAFDFVIKDDNEQPVVGEDGKPKTFLDYLEENDVLSIIPLDSRVYLIDDSKEEYVDGRTFIREFVLLSACNGNHTMEDVQEYYVKRIVKADEIGKEKKGIFGLFKK